MHLFQQTTQLWRADMNASNRLVSVTAQEISL